MADAGRQLSSNSRRLAACSAALLVTSLAAPAPEGQTLRRASAGAAATSVAAIVDGEPITLEDVDKHLGAKLVRVRSEEYQLRERGLSELIEKRIVEREATRRGTTSTALLEQGAGDPQGDLKAQAVKVYRAFPGRFAAQSEEEAIAEIASGLAAQRSTEIRARLVKESRVPVERRLQPFRVAIAPGGAAVLGSATAPVEIVEFSDFQCPYCARAAVTLKQVVAAYDGKVRLNFRHYPLNAIHKEAAKAAEAASCAGEQGKFWEMHDRLFENPQALQIGELKKAASEVGVDRPKFDACLDSARHAATWKGDLRAGQEYGVAGTPTIFINGRLVPGAPTFESLKGMIDQELTTRSVGTTGTSGQ